MKNTVYLILSGFLFFAAACDENNDGYYDNQPRLYFPAETDSLNYSFGDKLPEYNRHIVYFPVKMLGPKATREMKFKVSLDPEKTTAREGVHFTALAAEYTFSVDSVNAYIPIELLRDEIPEEEITYRIVLHIEASPDFELGIKENLTGILTFNNFLEEPGWWQNMFFSYAPNYKPGMYQRLIAYYGHPLEESYVWSNYLEVMAIFKTQVYDYAQEHPELGWQFNENLWWPFV